MTLQGQGLHRGIKRQQQVKEKLFTGSHPRFLPQPRVFVPTVASASVGSQLHEVWAGTRKALIVVNET